MEFETVGELVNLLNQFPQDCELVTELALIWDYPDDLKRSNVKVHTDEFTNKTIKYATRVGIFEGSWSKNNISNVNGKLEEFISK